MRSKLVGLTIIGAMLAGCSETPERARVVTVESEPSRASVARAIGGPKAKRKNAAPFRACDQHILARNGTTSCEMASNVFWGYWHAQQMGETTFEAYSPITKKTYEASCESGETVRCRAGEASVRFPATAIAAYDADQAARYAATHDVGPTGAAPSPKAVPEASDEPAAGCDPNYSGECLDPNSYDYDCEGGSGDGPDYTGAVEVVGNDPHGLDRDGDGYACE